MLDGPAGEHEEIERRRLDPAEDAALGRPTPGDLPPDSVCPECIDAYRRSIGVGGGDEEGPPGGPR